ncbi:MAG: TonB-dependent receptor [Terriglobia bacterium]
MFIKCSKYPRLIAWSVVFFSACVAAFAQRHGSLRGNVTDPSDAVVPRASVRVTAQPQGPSRVTQTNDQGYYEVTGLARGRYTVTAKAPGFAPSNPKNVEITATRGATLDIRLAIASQTQKVEVGARTSHLETAPQSNASAVVISGHNLSALSNDPDELQNQLLALAGPSVGSGGGEIYINGFIGGDLPPKSEIREIKVNSDPFSVENDRLGYGRIDILTRPGSASFHGDVSSEYNDSVVNALSPFLAASGEKPPSYHTWLWNGDLGSPLGKKVSFFFAVQRRNINRANLVNTDVLNSSLNIQPYVATVSNPRLLTSVDPRVDIQLSPMNTLSVSYGYYDISELNDGVDTQSLPSQAYDRSRHHHNLQIFDNQVLSPRIVNETRFQYLHFHDLESPLSIAPTIDVLGAFTGGGSGNGSLNRHESHYELQNDTTISLNHHLIQFGGFVRDIRRQQDDTANFNGTFTFNSLADYQQTEQGLQNGLTMAQIQAGGYGPSQFNITAGKLSASVNRIDGAIFLGDDWQLKPNFTASYGLRFESENVINHHAYWAPRVGIAWGLGHGRNTKTVLRAGWGNFYQRLDDDQMIVAARLNGLNQLTYVVNNPAFFPAPPPVSTLSVIATSFPTIYSIAPDFRLPYDMDMAVSIEHQLLPSTSVSLTYINSRGLNQFLTNDANAPLPGTFTPGDPASGVRPLGNAAGNIYQYESVGIYHQTQLIANIHVRASRLSLFGYYVFNNAHSDSAGIDSFATNPWNIHADYGRAAFDVRNRVMIGGTFAVPLGFRLSSVMMANSGLPFSINLAQDLYGTGIHNARPALATPSTPPADLVKTPYGAFNIAPGPKDTLIPPNTETGPSNLTLNLRLSRTFGFGGEGGALHGGTGTAEAGGSGHEDHRGGLGGRGLGTGGGFAMGGGTKHRYALTLSISALNVLNTVNFAPPVSVVGSPLFGRSISLAGGPFSAQVGNPVANRLINVGVSLSF